jgi:CelD/BcsL family acetyltransferase involved in cellulose biosynthesis
MEIVCPNNFKEIETVKERWDEILDKLTSDSPFSTYEWLSTWWRHFGKKKRLLCLLFQKKGELIGIAPLFSKLEITKGCPVRTIYFLGSPVSDRADFILGKDGAEVLKRFFQFLQEEYRKWDMMVLEQLPEDSVSVGMLRYFSKKSGLYFESFEQTKCPYIPLTKELSQQMERRGKQAVKDVRRKYRRLQDVGKVGFSRSIVHKDINEVIKIAREVDLKSHKYPDKTLFTNPQMSSFLKEVAQVFSEKKWFDFSVLSLNDIPIAYEIGFRYKNKLFSYTASYDERYARFSPGIGLMYRVIQDSIDLGLKEYDLLRGDQPYKWRWAKAFRRHLKIIVINNTYYGRFLYHLRSHIWPKLRTVKEKILKTQGSEES